MSIKKGVLAPQVLRALDAWSQLGGALRRVPPPLTPSWRRLAPSAVNAILIGILVPLAPNYST